jgi:hypothetical protein
MCSQTVADMPDLGVLLDDIYMYLIKWRINLGG